MILCARAAREQRADGSSRRHRDEVFVQDFEEGDVRHAKAVVLRDTQDQPVLAVGKGIEPAMPRNTGETADVCHVVRQCLGEGCAGNRHHLDLHGVAGVNYPDRRVASQWNVTSVMLSFSSPI